MPHLLPDDDEDCRKMWSWHWLTALSDRPLIVDYCHQIPCAVKLFKGQPQALPIHASILGVKSREMVFHDDGIGIDLELVL